MKLWKNPLAILALSTTTLLMSLSGHANTVAVWDSQAAIINTTYAKGKLDSLERTIKPKQQQLAALKKEIAAIQDKFRKDAKVMSQSDKQKLQADVQGKLNQYNSVAENIQRQIEATQTSIIKTMTPKVKGIRDGIIKQKNIDILLDKNQAGVSYVDPQWDLTNEITQQLNR